MDRNKLPTIKEIANKLNVSVSTVSRALSNHPRIGLRTKMRVQALAKELNYEPNIKAIMFKQRKTFVIGVIIPFIKEDFFSQAISGIETIALENDYTILFGQSFDDFNREKQVVNAMKKQRVDGLIISLSKQTTQYDHLMSLDAYNIPVVYFDRVPNTFDAHKVYCNLYQGTIDMVNWLFNQNKKRIAFINGPEKILASRERFEGYVEGISINKHKIDMALVERTDLSKTSTQQAMSKLLSLKTPPNAIISFNEYVHMDCVQYAQQHGVKINEDLAFVSYANLPITNYTAFPPIASIEQFPEMQGEHAMHLMIKILHENEESKDKRIQYYKEEIMPELAICK